MKHTSEKLKTVICPAAFKDFMIFRNSTTVCCPEWYDVEELANSYPEKFPPGKHKYPATVSFIDDYEDLLGNWNNKFHRDLRESILEGNYKFCSKKCPYIDKIYLEPHSKSNYLRDKNKVEEEYGIDLNNPTPKQVYFNFDKACNLKCPTCRVGMVTNKDTNDGIAQTLIETIEKQLSPEVETLCITGSGDAFYTNVFREYLHNFDKAKYPKLKEIFLNTNGILWTPKMWEYVKAVHPYVTGTEWSVDAATKYTYENVTRLNGSWDKLMANMDFVATQNIKNLIFSFVVQEANFMEMVPFCELIASKFEVAHPFDREKKVENSASVMFRALQHWGHQTPQWIKERNVSDPEHPKHKLFLAEVQKVHEYSFVQSNLSHLIEDYKNTNKTII